MVAYETAILVNSDNSLADGLSANGLSCVVDDPILLIKKDNIPNDTLNRLNNVKQSIFSRFNKCNVSFSSSS